MCRCLNSNARASAESWQLPRLKPSAASFEEPPGLRDGSGGKVYLAYLRDPDGNELCVLTAPPNKARLAAQAKNSLLLRAHSGGL